MTKQEVIESLCRITADVGEHFRSEYATDCFCEQGRQYVPFQFEQKTIDFIEEAVREKMERDGIPQSRFALKNAGYPEE